ncbi:hypothetical protein EsH8_II_000845 [Colletotrichum jinshuiense]
MAPTPTSAAAPKLPASADFNALYNRISLASAKQATFLTSMRAKYPSLARRSPATPTTTAAASTNGTFSSLTKPGAEAPQPTAPPSSSSQTPRQAQDDADLRFENPNTGLGYAAPKSEQATAAATRDLSRRLLGKRGRGDDRGVAVQKRRVQEDESEEEEGRTGLGRKKKKVRQASPQAEVAVEAQGEGEGQGAPDVEMSEDGAAQPDDAPKTADEPEAGGNDAQADVEQGDAAPSPAEGPATPLDPAEADTRPETGEAKKKKKKKNRNKKKKASGGGDGEAGEVAAA